MGHAPAQFGDLLLQSRKSLAELFALGGEFPTEFGLFGIEVPTLGGQPGTDSPLPASINPARVAPTASRQLSEC